MTVISMENDPETLTMIITAEFSAPIAQVWELWENPRLLERWWGPPAYPATVVDHDLSPGGRVSYFMTGPEGDRPHGWWRVIHSDPPYQLEFEDGFADETGQPDENMPVMLMRTTLSEDDHGRTRMVIETTFPSLEAMERIIAMGMQEGMTLAVLQIDGVLSTMGVERP